MPRQNLVIKYLIFYPKEDICSKNIYLQYQNRELVIKCFIFYLYKEFFVLTILYLFYQSMCGKNSLFYPMEEICSKNSLFYLKEDICFEMRYLHLFYHRETIHLRIRLL